MISQVSAFLENKPGRLEEVLQILNDNEINLRSISVAETTDYGIFRLILDRPTEAVERLRAANFVVKETAVLAIEIDDTKGALLNSIKELAENNISIEYTYTCLPINNEKVVIILRVDEMERAKKLLKASKNCLLLARKDMQSD